LPTALVTGAPERVPDIVIALKSAGFDILAAGVMSPEDAPDIEAGSVDCYVQMPVEGPAFERSEPTSASAGRGLRRARAVIAHELAARFDNAARFLPLLAPGATVVLVAEDADPDTAAPGSPGPDRQARRALAAMLAEAIVQDCGPAGIRAAVIGEDRGPDEIAALAAQRPVQPRPWWHYADVDPELDFADWRNSVLCLASVQDG